MDMLLSLRCVASPTVIVTESDNLPNTEVDSIRK